MEQTEVERIGAIVDDWNRAWQIKDPVLAAAGYSEQAEFTNAFGFSRTGRGAIETYLTEVFGFDFVMAGSSREVFRDVQFLRQDVALVRSKIERAGQKTGDGAELGVRHTSHLRVFSLAGGTWHIVSHLISDARETKRPKH